MALEEKPHLKYQLLDDESDKGETDNFLSQRSSSSEDGPGPWYKPHQRPLRNIIAIFPWVSTVVLAVLCLVLYSKIQHVSEEFGSYEAGFRPDMSFIDRVPLREVRFSGSPHFYANGSSWRDPVDPTAPWPENMQLLGDPSPEVDENWKQYIGKRYFSISEEEATRAWGDKRHEYIDQRHGGYTAGLDVFHNLHCINALRIALHPEYYQANSSRHGHNHLTHTEHCLDILRQSIQCYGSTTLIPTKFFEGLERNYIDSDQTHVCRDFNYLRDFVTSRARGHEAYVPRDRSLLDERKHAIVQQHFAEKKAKQKAENPSN